MLQQTLFSPLGVAIPRIRCLEDQSHSFYKCWRRMGEPPGNEHRAGQRKPATSHTTVPAEPWNTGRNEYGSAGCQHLKLFQRPLSVWGGRVWKTNARPESSRKSISTGLTLEPKWQYIEAILDEDVIRKVCYNIHIVRVRYTSEHHKVTLSAYHPCR